MNDWLNYRKPFCAISLETYRGNAHRFTPMSTGSCSPREPHALAWGPSSSHTEILRVERARLKIGEKLPTAYKFCTYWSIRYSSTCYLKVRIDPLMANIRNLDCVASPVVNASWFVVVRPCYLNRDLLSGPKGNRFQAQFLRHWPVWAMVHVISHCQTGNKSLYKPKVTRFTVTDMRHQASLC